MRKIKLDAAPATLTSGNKTRIEHTIPAVTMIATTGAPFLTSSMLSADGSVRSRAMARAIREAANKFA
jgi:hypothetical protein